MFQAFRALPEAVRSVTIALEHVDQSLRDYLTLQEQAGAVLERVEHLERTRSIWEAEIEAGVLKADGKLKAANNAESRARTMERHVEKHLDPFDEDGEEGALQEQGQGQLSELDVEAGNEQGVLPVPVGLEGPKSNAINRKFY